MLAAAVDGLVLLALGTVLRLALGDGYPPLWTRVGGSVVHLAALLKRTGLLLLLHWLYYALTESSSWQATLGKLAVGLVVTDEAGRRISFARGTGRYFAKVLSGLALCVGYLMVAFTQRKRGLHDILAGTLVFRTRDPHLLGLNGCSFRVKGER
ncbi:RDD family protein [Novosphingobium sp. 9]|uniref:RDD family protein n=1 Tax=Novosphingobium sp. 9 TaxID=2025349 RepID=UPI0021B54F14|nr:RDD family protein [Novosphingobium sp. 9]